MKFQQVFKGWDQLIVEDLILAYRKAKVDCFFENAFPTAINFAEYEINLISNLEKLLTRLKINQGLGSLDELLGPCRLIPKKLGYEAKNGSENGHTHFSNHKKAFEHICKHNDLTAEFRIIGDFPVETHLLSALWINMVGHKFDACLNDKDIYGSRLKRIRSDDLNKEAPKVFHLTAVGSFEPYFQPYQKWRNDGLTAIRTELEQDRKVIAVSLDLKSYYHLIDPTFFAEPEFQHEIGLKGDDKLTESEHSFTKEISRLLVAWSEKAEEFSIEIQAEGGQPVNGGLAIGLTASRVISNLLLHKWDKLIRENLTPVHYGRYVDDMFLVMLDGGAVSDTSSFMSFLRKRLPNVVNKVTNQKDSKGQADDKSWQIDLGKNYQKNSKIQLQANKQKLFLLDGKAGLDLIESIEKEIVELSSERRLMPTPDQLERTTAAKVLSAAGDIAENADTLRRADGLTIHRLSWALQLSHVETLARDLPSNEWKVERYDFYEFAHNHVLRPDKIFAHYQYLPRLLGFAISLQDWQDAEKIVSASLRALEALARENGRFVTINGIESCTQSPDIWAKIKVSLIRSFVDSAAKSYPQNSKPHTKATRLAKVFSDLLLGELMVWDDLSGILLAFDSFIEIAPLLASSDLAKIPYKNLDYEIFPKEFLRFKFGVEDANLHIISQSFQSTTLLSVETIQEFLSDTQHKRFNTNKQETQVDESILPFLFPTRPFTPEEIAVLVPECVGSLDGKADFSPVKLWARYVQAFRGVWVSPGALEVQAKEKNETDEGLPYFRIGQKANKKVLVAITNLATEDESWTKTACNKPDLSLERYKRICELVNLAITSKPKPHYVLLPELSIPIEWVDSISSRLRGSGINMIAGTEYRHVSRDTLHSEVCLVLDDDRLGFPASVRIWQPKLRPAVGEDYDLTSRIGKKWKQFEKDEQKKPVYDHHGFNFGVMVCSELQNSKDRVKFQGEVDALMVLSWNKDLDTFSALVEASALDIHAYTILVNNRKYGDSRVRSPAKDSFLRDLARIKGGKNDYCVTVEIDIEKLREFQSREKRWTDDTDPFKPVPEGFEMARRRKVIPFK
jgi:hypothetical protein